MSSKLADVVVLIVDDQRNMRALWRAILLSFGVRHVVEANGALNAFEVLRNQEVDIAVVDMVLDELSGVEFVRLLRTSPDSACDTLPVIACTAHTRRSAIEDLINAGVDEILTKPVSVENAWRKIAAVVNHRRLFVRSPDFVGPDRRRNPDPAHAGPWRRWDDFDHEELDDAL